MPSHRRVGHLREELFEVVVQQLRLVREDREGRIVAHRADGLVAVARHRRHQDVQVFRRVAEGPLPLQHSLVVRLVDARPVGQEFQRHQVFAHPLAVRPGERDLLLQLVVADDAALFKVDQQHAPRLETALALDAFRLDVQHADLGRHDDQAVLGDVVARRPEPVAVQHRADADAVRKRDRRRPVPRLHEAGVKLVKGPLLRRHRRVAAPRLRDHHHHGVRQRPAGEHQQFEDVVEHCGYRCRSDRRRAATS